MKISYFECPKCKGKFQHIFRVKYTPHIVKPLYCPYCGNIENLKEVKNESKN